MISTPQKTIVAVFVRCPVPGRVKTRLASDLGNEDACDLYRAMVEDCVANVRSSGLPLFLFHDGQDADEVPAEWVGAAESVFRQQGETLDDRMTAAFEMSFSAGAAGVILIGSDIPGIDAGLLQVAQAASETHDAVFSPAIDGGYCLVASKNGRFNSKIFQEIPWSTAHVLDLTVSACSAHGISYTLLAPRQDIDTLDDLKAYCRRPSPHATATNNWLVSHGYMVPLLSE